MHRRKAAVVLGALLLAAGALMFPVGGSDGSPAPARGPRVAGVDLSAFPADGPAAKTDLLFIHHSCGGQWLAGPGGPADGDGERSKCIYSRHANGGDLRARLEAAGYLVHEASYGSDVGESTDLFDWLPKMRTKMDRVLRVEENDRLLPEGRTNRVVVFKSCFPNSDFVGRGEPPGNPAGPALTLANARATMTAVLGELRKRPEVLFVYVTAPPLAAEPPIPAWKALARGLKNKMRSSVEPAPLPRDESGALARELNDWMKSPGGWLSGYPLPNVVVFDYFDVLTDEGKQNVAAYPSPGGDSHPTGPGNQKATAAFVPFLNRALRRFAAKGGVPAQ